MEGPCGRECECENGPEVRGRYAHALTPCGPAWPAVHCNSGGWGPFETVSQTRTPLSLITPQGLGPQKHRGHKIRANLGHARFFPHKSFLDRCQWTNLRSGPSSPFSKTPPPTNCAQGAQGGGPSLVAFHPELRRWTHDTLFLPGNMGTDAELRSCGAPPPPPPPPMFMPDCGVHYLWFAFVCFLIRSHPPGVFSSRQAAGCSFRPCR